MTTTAALKRSNDRKVTNLVSPNGKTPKIANAFGLPSGRAFSCPGATTVCEDICYAGKLEKIYKGVRNVLTANFDALQNANGVAGMAELLQTMVDEFRADCIKAESKGAKIKRAFRIHWDGDFFSADYAAAWAWVIAGNTDIHFWVYTRSFHGAVNVLPIFDGMADRQNLSLYLSVDRDNVAAAVSARKEFGWVLWAWLADNFADGMADMPESGSKRFPCPENGGRIPLIDVKGSACIRCGICPDARGDVVFSASKR